MKNSITVALAILVFTCPVLAQFTSVAYDFERNWFNEGQPLPAEKSLIVKGVIPTETEVLELSILSSKRSDELYKATWQRASNNELTLIVPFKLRASSEYDFVLNFFSTLDASDESALQEKLLNTLNAYIDVNLKGDKSIKLSTNSKKTFKQLNEIIAIQLGAYRSKMIGWQTQFSEIVQLKLAQLEKADLDKDYSRKDTTTTKQGVRSSARLQMVNELKAQLEREIKQILDTDLLVLSNTRMIDNYTTEEKTNSIAINVGYGGVYLSGDWDDFTSGDSPYLGLAFPLGNSVLGSRFLSHTTVTLGVFLRTFTDENGNEVKGLVVKNPVYLGLDHKLFKFIRVNAGATFLEGLNVSEIPDIDPSKKIMVRPYLGLSARVDLSIGLGK